MSRYTAYAETDLMVTIGMDFAVQFWITDTDGQPLRVIPPAQMTVRDNYSAILFTTRDPVNIVPGDPEVDYLTDAVLMISPENGMVQVTIPRAMTANWPVGTFVYDIWGTVDQGEPAEQTGWGDVFPNDQHLPLARGRFTISQRVTVMD